MCRAGPARMVGAEGHVGGRVRKWTVVLLPPENLEGPHQGPRTVEAGDRTVMFGNTALT